MTERETRWTAIETVSWLDEIERAATVDELQVIVHRLSPPPDLPTPDLEAIGTAIGKRFNDLRS